MSNNEADGSIFGHAISSDGMTNVGMFNSKSNSREVIFRWTVKAGMTRIGEAELNDFWMIYNGCSLLQHAVNPGEV